MLKINKNKIILKNIKKSYNNKTVINIKESVIPLNGIVAIIGWSGSGKSTLLNIISLIDYPDLDKSNDNPTIEILTNTVDYKICYKKNGNPIILKKLHEKEQFVSANDFRRDLFGYVFQHHYLHPNFNLENNIKTPLLSQKKTITKEKLEYISEYIDINDQLLKYVNEVSGGQAQRASILRAMIKKCPIILGDELTSNIDYKKARQILDELRRSVYDETHELKTFIWVSHDIHLIKEYADIIITIKNGNIQCVDNTFESFSEILELLQKKHYPYIPDSSVNIKEPEYLQNQVEMYNQQFNHADHFQLNQKDNQLANLQNKKRISYFDFDHKVSSAKERFKYYVSYAFNDLSRRHNIKPIPLFPKLSVKIRLPVIDYSIVVLSLTIVILFLLSILKISFGSHKYLEIKLSDPRINSIEIRGNEKIAGELTEKHINDIKKNIGHMIKYISPVYYVRTSLLEVSTKQFMSNGNAITFRKDDPIILEILGSKHKNFVSDSVHYKGFIIQNSSMQRFGYSDSENCVIRPRYFAPFFA